MQLAPLGATGIQVSRVMFGAMARSESDAATRIRLVQTAVDAGITTIDTAPLYEFGDSERWVGRAIAGRRDEVVLCSKVGLRWDDEHGDILFSFPDSNGRWTSVRKDSRPASIRSEVDESLRRLGVDHLDLLQVHHPDRLVPIADTVGTLAEIVRAGKARAIGVSNYSLAQAQQAQVALGGLPLASVQPSYSLLDLRVEQALLPWARAENVAVLAYSPLAEGLLAGKYQYDRPTSDDGNPRLHPKNLRRIRQAVADSLEPIASGRRVSMAAVALAWLLAEPGLTAVITGASRPDQILASSAAANLELSGQERAHLRRVFESVALDPRVGHRRRDRALQLLTKVRRRTAGVAKRLIGLRSV